MTGGRSAQNRAIVFFTALALGIGILPAYATAAERQPEVGPVAQVEEVAQVAPASRPVPFTCEPKLYQAASASGRYLFEYTLNGTTGFSFDKIGADNGGLNALGYNTADNYIYGNNNGPKLIRLGSNGVVQVVANSLAPSINGHNSGDFWGRNILISAPGTTNDWVKVDLTNPNNPVSTSFPLTGTRYTGSDIAILGNTAYAIHDEGTGLFVIDLLGQTIRLKPLSGLSSHGVIGYGAAFADAQGNLFFHRNGGHVYRIWGDDLALDRVPIEEVGDIPKYGTSTPSTLSAPNDGASCADAQSPYSATIASEASSLISASTATVTASVDPQSLSTTATICYGTSSTTSGGALQGCTNSTQAGNASTGNPLTGTSSVPLDPITLSGLTARTTYYWQVKTVSAYATTYGAVQPFTTTGAPVVVTQPVSSVGSTTASVNGTVNPGGLSATVEFCVGTASDLTGCTSTTAGQSPLAAGSADQSVSASLSGLTPGTTYYVRVSARNTDGTIGGSIRSFTTTSPPAVTIGAASGVTSTDARVNATVNPQGSATSVSFCYGTAADFTGCTAVSAAESPLVAVDANLPVTADLTGLSAATTYYVRATATNGNGPTVSTDDSFTTDPTPLVVTTTTGALTTGVVGTAYSRTLSAAGGVAPYTWSVAAGALPAGLSLNATTGEVSGTPTTAGDASFTIGVTDGNAQSDSKGFTLSVVARPAVSVSSSTSVGSTTVTLNGSVDPGNLVTTVDFCVGTTIDLSGCTVIAADESPLAKATASSAVSVGISGLTPGTTYYARVQAANSAGGGTSPMVSFTTTAAPAVTTGAATFRRENMVGSTGDATFNASVNPNGADTTVSFCWGTTPTLVGCTAGAATQSPVTGSSSTVNVSRTVTGLSLGATYYFNVTASNGAGNTVASTVEFTMPTSSAPTPTITSNWTATGDAAGGESRTINGRNFSTTGIGVTVSIGGANAPVTNTTATAITVTTPPGVVGAADVVVSNNDGQAVRATGKFTYTSASYTLTYDGNGASVGSAPIDGSGYTYGSSATVAGAATLLRGGYEFLGWNTAANGSGTTVLVGAGLSITGNTTLYAQWNGVPIVNASTSSVDFGARLISDGVSPAQTITVTNGGGAAATINTGGLSVAGSAASDFAVSGGTCAPSGVIAAGSSCTIEVVFDPSVAGARTASVSVATTAGTVTVALSGTGTIPTPTPTPTPTPAPDPAPAPVVASGPPLGVNAVAGDTRVSVSWGAPVSSGSFPVTHYRMRATPGGASCVVAAPAVSCVIEGLTNGAVYTVTGQALTGAGWGATSAPSAPVTPSGSAQPVPQPDPVPGPVPAGSVKVTIDGQLDPQATATPQGGAVVVVSGDYTVDAAALDPAGRALPLGDADQVQPIAGQRLEVSGARFHPSTYAAVYVHYPEPQTRTTAREAVIIGAVLVDESGLFTGAWVLPDEVVAGEYILQVVGTTSRLEALSANLAMTVTEAQTRSITISARRDVTRTGAQRITVIGRTQGLDGQVVQARVRYPGQRRYFSGSTRIVREDEFTWQRLTNRRIYVYFQATDADGQKVRSNRITVPRVAR